LVHSRTAATIAVNDWWCSITFVTVIGYQHREQRLFTVGVAQREQRRRVDDTVAAR